MTVGSFGAVGPLLVLISLSVGVAFLFRYLWTAQSRLRAHVIGVSLSLFVTLYGGFAVEAYFRFFVVNSYDFGYDKAGLLWFKRYWRPTNAQGYRDVEHRATDVEGKSVVFVVGDSFVAGYGIKNINDRLSGELQRHLTSGRVITIAKNGWGTLEEYEAVRSHPYRPTVIVWSYVVNDIQSTGERQGLPFSFPAFMDAAHVQSLVKASYSLNYAYWSAYRVAHPELGETYWRYLEDLHRNDAVWGAHRDELDGVVQYVRERRIGLIVVVWPDLRRIEKSRIFTRKVLGLLRERGVQVIDMAQVLAGRDPSDLIVHGGDGHPNVRLHRQVGGLLVQEVGRLATE